MRSRASSALAACGLAVAWLATAASAGQNPTRLGGHVDIGIGSSVVRPLPQERAFSGTASLGLSLPLRGVARLALQLSATGSIDITLRIPEASNAGDRRLFHGLDRFRIRARRTCGRTLWLRRHWRGTRNAGGRSGARRGVGNRHRQSPAQRLRLGSCRGLPLGRWNERREVSSGVTAALHDLRRGNLIGLRTHHRRGLLATAENRTRSRSRHTPPAAARLPASSSRLLP